MTITTDRRPRWPAYPVAGALAVLAVIAIAGVTPVPTDRTALIVGFDRTLRVINPWNADQAGLAWHVPLADRVVWFDRRLRTVSTGSAQVVTSDGQPLTVDAFATWRVTDPARFYQTLGARGPDAASEVGDLLGQAVRRQIGRTTLAVALALWQGASTGALPGALPETGWGQLRTALDRDLAGYGVRAGDVGLSHLSLADGAPVDMALAQMSGRADAKAREIASEGHRHAQIIRAEGAVQAGRIYAASFGKDPEFYDFYRAMQSYDAVLAQKGNRTTIVLSPDNAYLRQFRGK